MGLLWEPSPSPETGTGSIQVLEFGVERVTLYNLHAFLDSVITVMLKRKALVLIFTPCIKIIKLAK